MGKKWKANRVASTNALNEDELQESATAMENLVQDNLDGLRTQQANVASQVQIQLNQLTTTLNEVKQMMDTMEYRIDPNIPLLTMPWEPPIKVIIQAHAIEVKEETTAETKNNTAEIDFSKFLLDDLYIIQQATTAELRLRKKDIAHQTVKQRMKAKLCKTLLQGKE